MRRIAALGLLCALTGCATATPYGWSPERQQQEIQKHTDSLRVKGDHRRLRRLQLVTAKNIRSGVTTISDLRAVALKDGYEITRENYAVHGNTEFTTYRLRRPGFESLDTEFYSTMYGYHFYFEDGVLSSYSKWR